MQSFEVPKRLRCFLSELVGTATFLFISTTAASTAGGDTLAIATAFGIGLATAIYIAGPVSGGHLNPAVTFAMMISGNMEVLDGFGYIISQCSGAIAGSAIGYGVLGSSKYAGYLGVAEALNQRQGLVAEIVGTFILVTIVFNVAIQTSSGLLTPTKLSVRASAPQVIGFAVWAIHLAMVPINGCGINPARALGTALINNKFDDHWIFWAGPAIGALSAMAIQIILFGTAKGVDLQEEDELMQIRKVTDSQIIV